MGGWHVTDADDNRLPLGVGRQIEPGAELRLHSPAARTPEKVFACVDEEVLDDDGDELTLRDSAGGEVATFAYGSAGD